MIETKDELSEALAVGNKLVNMNVRISQTAQEMLNMMLALKQAEENERKYPKQLLVENMIRGYFPLFVEEFEKRNKNLKKQQTNTKDYLSYAEQIVENYRAGKPL